MTLLKYVVDTENFEKILLKPSQNYYKKYNNRTNCLNNNYFEKVNNILQTVLMINQLIGPFSYRTCLRYQYRVHSGSA